ncbi:MAG: type II toxin-antitoxin system CcdA family antitoxin [Acidimicrobiales bacterium]
MARVNVYLSDDLAEEARAAGLSVSGILQEALRRELAGRRTTAWLETIRDLPRSGVTHDEAIDALDTARAEAGDDWPESRRADLGG